MHYHGRRSRNAAPSVCTQKTFAVPRGEAIFDQKTFRRVAERERKKERETERERRRSSPVSNGI